MGDKCLSFVLSCPLWKPKSARNSRFVLAVLCLNDSLGWQTIKPLLADLVYGLNEAATLEGGSFVVTEIGGDWKYFRESLAIKTHWNSPAICHHCTIARQDIASLPNLTFRNLRGFIDEVSHDDASPFLLLKDFDPSKITWCVLHNLYLGLMLG